MIETFGVCASRGQMTKKLNYHEPNLRDGQR